LEKNVISPSLDSLLKLSEKLNAQPIYFLMDRESGPMQKMVINPTERQEVHPPNIKNSEVKLELLVSDTLNRRMEPYLLTFRKGKSVEGHFYPHKGDEFAYVIEGEMEFEIQEEKHLLKKGDSLYLGSTFPSKWANIGMGDATLLWIVSPPRGAW
jgi:quercetin dioxygenase-like cupin family protein